MSKIPGPRRVPRSRRRPATTADAAAFRAPGHQIPRGAAPPDDRERLRAEAAFWERLCAAVVHAAGCAGLAWDRRTPLGRMVPEVSALIAPHHAEFARRTLYNDARWRDLLEREGWAAAVRQSLEDPAPAASEPAS